MFTCLQRLLACISHQFWLISLVLALSPHPWRIAPLVTHPRPNFVFRQAACTAAFGLAASTMPGPKSFFWFCFSMRCGPLLFWLQFRCCSPFFHSELLSCCCSFPTTLTAQVTTSRQLFASSCCFRRIPYGLDRAISGSASAFVDVTSDAIIIAAVEPSPAQKEDRRWVQVSCTHMPRCNIPSVHVPSWHFSCTHMPRCNIPSVHVPSPHFSCTHMPRCNIPSVPSPKRYALQSPSRCSGN